MEPTPGAEQTLSQQIESYLALRGGTVVQKLVLVMKKVYGEDAPELQSEEALKAYVAQQPEVFKVITSCNDVERVKLVNPPRRDRRRRNSLLMDITVRLLEEMAATSEESATTLAELYAKVQGAYASEAATVAAAAADGEEAPEASPVELSSEDEFARSLGARRKRIVLRTGRVWLQPPEPRERAPREGGAAEPRERRPRGERLPREERGPREDRPPRERRPREDRPPRPTGVAQEITLPDDANDATLIAKLVYEKLATRGATCLEHGVPIKVVLRFVSLDFKDARPDVDAPAMSSLRVFKHLLASLPGISRDRPIKTRRADSHYDASRRPPPIEPVIWVDDEAALLAAIRGGLAEELAHAVAAPETMDDCAAAESGVPVQHKVLDQETWQTSVIGPTSSEEVLKKFLADNVDQQIWGFETEHRVGLGRRPAGNIAIIAISCLSNTFLWDSHNGGIPDCLHSWLADDKFFKGGVKLGPKAQKLRLQFAAAPKQFVELTLVAQALDYIEEASKAGMRVISKNVLNLAVNRPPGIRDSNWETRPLTKLQYHYAIEDAYVSALLFVHMSAKLHKMERGDMLIKAAINLD